MVAGNLACFIGPARVMRLMCIVPVVLFRRRPSMLWMYSNVLGVKVLLKLVWDASWSYWEAVFRQGLCGLISYLRPWDKWFLLDLHGFLKWVFDFFGLLNDFFRQVVVFREDIGIRKWTVFYAVCLAQA